MIGLFGIAVGALLLIFDLCSIETYGVPYLSPYVSSDGKDLKDSIVRVPLPFIKKRPWGLKTPNERRQK
jgi:spore germination protein KA